MAKSYLYPPQPTVSITTGPVEQVFDGVPSPVEYDSANPANNKPLASGLFFLKDGNFTPVLEDTITPANNEPLPVKLTGVTGDVIINAGDLNVSTSATNDSMAIGDGVTGNLAIVDLNNDATTYALKVKDDDANTALAAIQTATGAGATEATLATVAKEVTLDAVKTATEALALVDFATFTEQQAQTTELGQISSDAQVLASTVNLDGNPAGTTGIMIGGKDSGGDFQQASVNAAGELSVTFGSAGFATETTLSALNNKVANNYGAASGAVRSAAQIGNATGQADFNSGADSAQTLRVSANLKRAGNELSYNTGAADANTQRVAVATGSDIQQGIGSITDVSEQSSVANASLIAFTKGMVAFLDSIASSVASKALDSIGQLAVSGTLTAPVGAKGFTIQNSSRASGALRFAPSGASATVGFLLEPGQSTSYQDGAGNISVFDVDGVGIDCTVIWYV